MTNYLTNAQYRAAKSALDRAINSGDPEKVIAACLKVKAAWVGYAWPDDWHRWNIALLDATHGREDMDSI